MIKPNTRITVKTASSGDGFVGLNINADSVEVIFPMGYHLSFEKNDMAVDIKNLILILHRFSEKKDGVLRISPGALHDVEKEIPVSPFLWILYDWKHNGYYKESESSYHSSLNGKVHWGRTIKIKKPLISGNSPVYLDFIVKKSEIKENILTEIHKYCVLKAYEIIGFLFLPIYPEIPKIVADNKLFISVVKAKLSSVFQQKEYILFHNILSILESLDNIKKDDIYTFGTNSFEVIWEKLIDDMYGIKKITGFYPETTWYLTSGKSFRNMPLRPDTIMKYGEKIYIIDAKYYQFGINNYGLPDSSSVAKQIIYGDYVDKKFKSQKKVFNIFILPYDGSQDSCNIQYIGYAESNWKNNRQEQFKPYFKVHTFLLDVKSLMYSYLSASHVKKISYKTKLASLMEKYSENNDSR